MVTLILSWPLLWDLLPQQPLAPVKDQAPPPFQVRISPILFACHLENERTPFGNKFYRSTLYIKGTSLDLKSSCFSELSSICQWNFGVHGHTFHQLRFVKCVKIPLHEVTNLLLILGYFSVGLFSRYSMLFQNIRLLCLVYFYSCYQMALLNYRSFHRAICSRIQGSKGQCSFHIKIVMWQCCSAALSAGTPLCQVRSLIYFW